MRRAVFVILIGLTACARIPGTQAAVPEAPPTALA